MSELAFNLKGGPFLPLKFRLIPVASLAGPTKNDGSSAIAPGMSILPAEAAIPEAV